MLKTMSWQLKARLGLGLLTMILLLTGVISNEWARMIITGVVYIIVSYPVLRAAFRDLFVRHRMSEQFLMTIATFGALGLRDYPEALAVMVFYLIGDAFEDYASQRSHNEIASLVKLKPNKVRVVNDQIGTPTYTYDLARLLVDMCETEKYGYYHATNEGDYISWYDFCCEFYKQYGLKTKVIPVSTEEYGLSKAARPFNSRLDKKKLAENGFKPLPTWQDAVSRYLKEAQL